MQEIWLILKLSFIMDKNVLLEAFSLLNAHDAQATIVDMLKDNNKFNL